MHTQSAIAAQDDRSRERPVRRGGQMGGSISGSVGGWLDGVRGQVWHTSTHLRISRPEWRDLVGLSGNRCSLAFPISARCRKTVARFRLVRVVSKHRLPLYPSAGHADLSRSVGTIHLACW